MITYNKLSEVMMPFHGGNKVRPRINVTMGNKTFNWLFDTGAAITCMNSDSFRESFGHQRPRLITNSAGCIAANGSRMESMGIYKIEMTIRGRKFLHPVTIVEDLNDNILGIDFMHQHKLMHIPNKLHSPIYSQTHFTQSKRLLFLPYLQ
jgi:Retroviral aspartyl protease